MSSTKTHLSRVGVVIIPVADQEKAIDFYTSTLGFEVRVDVPMGPDARWVEVGLPGAETTIAVCPPPPGGATGNKETGIALHTPDIEALHADLKARGVDVDDEISRFGGDIPPLLWLRDPEGNVLIAAETR